MQDRSTTETESPHPPQSPRIERLLSLDAYRGLIMISLAFVGFGLADTANNYLEENPDSTFWQGVQYQFSHAQWVGCSYWDLIQPSFMFMVGASMAYSYAKRQSQGHSYARMCCHAFSRALILILLSVFLISTSQSQTDWAFTNVLAQIGLGYGFLFLLWKRSPTVQAVAAVAILLVVCGMFELYPNPGIDLAKGAPELGVSQEWAEENLSDVRKPWHKNANIGHAIDVRFLNWFPTQEAFEFNAGGYQTLNFLPSIVTMLFGLMSGELLRSPRSARFQLLTLFLGGLAALGIGYALDYYHVCPLVKRIWTPTWAIFSTGWCCLILGSLYGIIDVLKLRAWSFPLVVVGMNSIAIYCMSMTLKPWIGRQLKIHLGTEIFSLYGNVSPAVVPSVQATLVGLMLWLACYFLYRNKAFLRI